MQVHPHKRSRRAAVAAVLVFLLAGAAACSSDDGDDDAGGATTAATETTEAAAPEDVEFTYEGDTGPEHWGELSEEFATCAEGVEQSPVDLTDAAETALTDIAFDYSESPLNIFNNGHTIEVEYEEGSTIDLDGETYNVVQFHFHAASEHTVDGEQFPLELHIVHATEDEQLAVVGVLIDVGAENEALAPVFDNIPTEVSEEPTTIDGESVNLAEVLPDTQTYYQYPGSLTTPPCTEGVSWQVLDTPIEISQEQLDAFTAVVDGNFRPVQPLNDRELDNDDGADQ